MLPAKISEWQAREEKEKVEMLPAKITEYVNLTYLMSWMTDN